MAGADGSASSWARPRYAAMTPAKSSVDAGGLMARRQAGTWVRPPGVAVALHQGPGLADVLYADAAPRSAIVAADEQPGRG